SAYLGDAAEVEPAVWGRVAARFCRFSGTKPLVRATRRISPLDGEHYGRRSAGTGEWSQGYGRFLSGIRGSGQEWAKSCRQRKGLRRGSSRRAERIVLARSILFEVRYRRAEDRIGRPELHDRRRHA